MQPRWMLPFGIAAFALCGMFARAFAEVPPSAAACCDNGFRTVAETRYRTVVVQRCRMSPVTTPIKKTVYSTKAVPYCLTSPCCCRHGVEGGCAECGACPDCEESPRTKCVLLKREIVVGQKTVMKCVLVDELQEVPYVVYRQIPCDDSVAPCDPAAETSPVPPSPATAPAP